jgi:hypothetical protein
VVTETGLVYYELLPDIQGQQSLGHPDYKGGGAWWSGITKANSVIEVTNKKLPLSAKVKFLKAELLYITVNNSNSNNNNNNC